MFKAILLTRDGENDGRTVAQIAALSDDDLPEGDVRIRVSYSTLNYKDALAITGAGPVVRIWPMVPGIDLAGVVEESRDPRFAPGDAVMVNGWGVGETRWGGLSQKARLPGDLLTRLPVGLTAREAMAIGTAGYTAMLSVQALEAGGVRPGDGDVLVTGANGGVGGFAIAILAAKGFSVAASTGRIEEAARLHALGAAKIVDREDFTAAGRPLQKERWAGAIDSVGGHTLANVCASTRYGGIVTACGLAGGMDFPATVAPFILRGVTLVGIDSVMAPHWKRDIAWGALAASLSKPMLSLMAEELSLDQALAAASDLISGKVRGRLIVDPNR